MAARSVSVLFLVIYVSLNLRMCRAGAMSGNITSSQHTGRAFDLDETVNSLQQPEWLNVATDSKVAKYRARRFVAFPASSTLKVK